MDKREVDKKYVDGTVASRDKEKRERPLFNIYVTYFTYYFY